MNRVVVVGGGIAGTSAAFSARRQNSKAEIIIITDEPTPLYSPCILPEYLSGEIPRTQVFLKRMLHYSQQGIKTIFNSSVLEINATDKKITLDDATLEYDILIIATGSRANLPNIEGVNLKQVSPFKSLADADRISQMLTNRSKSAVVIGAGPIGVEVAASLKKKGLRVFLVETMDSILPHLFDPDLATILENRLAADGVQILKGNKVLMILENSRMRAVRLSDREIECDLVIFCTGTKPNVELAETAGIAVGPKGGIHVNEFMMTTIEGIYACGDCCEVNGGLSALWADAQREGVVAGSNSLGAQMRFTKLLRFTLINVLGMTAASVGDPPKSNETYKFDRRSSRGHYRLFTADGRIVGAQMIEPDKDAYVIVNAVIMGQNWPSTKPSLRDGMAARFRWLGEQIGKEVKYKI
jgi:NAD(P)H-nitrite reductase large subunit